ncbi:response regulator transcription factor [Angelakisella massiliensis]|uniref:response regulator transcription factor n=1 Tax=Angelakisella massiliensis TaxID=1871018 RepID=UPI0008F91DB7|nr:response regulator transcription factor [Angelakisella massiliensis]
MRILMVEDDPGLCEAVSFQLEQKGVTVDVCHDGEDGLHWARQQAYDLILLDRMLPGLDGLSVLRSLRQEGIVTPVVLVTALGEISQRVEGLDAGADDYLVKPFAAEELMARIRAMSRRPRQWESSQIIRLGDVVFDREQKTLEKEGQSCTLSRRESELMEMLLKNPGQILPRGLLLSRVWGPEAEVEEGNLDNYIHFLRRRLRSVGSALEIRTVRGVGYQLEVPHV